MASVLRDRSTGDLYRPSERWDPSAPRRLVTKWSAAGADRRWVLWQRHLARRRKPREPDFLSGQHPPVMWCWLNGRERDELSLAGDGLVRRAERWLDGDRGSELSAITLAYALPGLAQALPAGIWWRLAESLCDRARDVAPLPFELRDDPHELVREQLLAGELPLALAYLFPEVAPLVALQKPARRALSDAILAMTDRRGEPHARVLPVLGPLLACWTRARWSGDRLPRGCWSRPAEMQYRWLIRRSIRLADGRGRFLLGGAEADTDTGDVRSLLATALDLVGDDADCAAAATAIARSIVPQRARSVDGRLPKASLHSEWSGVAVLASGWTRSAPRLAVTYADDPPSLELQVAGRQVLAGSWLTETSCDGRPVAPTGAWEEICWQSDEDCDYLELGIELSEGLLLERQILLAKEDELLYVADVVLAGDRVPRRLRHVFGLPLGRDVTWRPERETRDGLLVLGKRRIAVLPLALLEWRSDPRGGALDAGAGRLTLTQESEGAALCCPLVLDLRSRRSKNERTWRQLTVAESLRAVPRDVAVGFRAQSGRDQWLFYRSLGPAGNRTVLGQNVSSEFFAGRFLDTGETDEWIEIEAKA